MPQLWYDQSRLKVLSPSLYPDIHLTTLDSRGRRLPAHRIILVTVSNKFEQIISSHVSDDEPVMVRNIIFEILEKIVNLVYKGIVDIQDTTEEEDMWDGLHMLRMVDHNMGLIYGISDGHSSITNSQLSVGQLVERTQKCSGISEERMLVTNMDETVLMKNPVVNLKKTIRTSKLLGNNEDTEPSKLFKCDISQIGLRNNSGLQKLGYTKKFKRDTTTESKTFVCDICLASYKFSQSLRRHLLEEHGITSSTNNNRMKRPISKDNKVKSKAFVCDICLASYKFSQSLRRHLLKEHGIISPTNNNSIKSPISKDNKVIIQNVKDGVIDDKDKPEGESGNHVNNNMKSQCHERRNYVSCTINDQESTCSEEIGGDCDDSPNSDNADRVVCLFCEKSYKNKKSQLNHHLRKHRKQWILLKSQIDM